MDTWETIEKLKEIHKDDKNILLGIEEIENQLRFLNCLECAGVDNWSGYDYAIELFNEGENE